MARLTLEEGGQTRRFKLSSGKLTFGSGDRATLKMASDDIADLHGQIEMGPDGAVLRTAKGVVSAKVNGVPVQGAHTLKAGQAVTIGGAKLSIEYDEGEGPGNVARPVGVQATRGAAAGGRQRAGGGSRSDAAGGYRGDRRRQQSKSSPIPTWLVVAVILVGAVGGGFALFSNTQKNLKGEEFDFDVWYGRYQREKAENPVDARRTLNQIAAAELTPDQRRLIEAEVADRNKDLAGVDDALRNQKISPWADSRLINYANGSWDPKSNRAHARLFMKRARWFTSEYPTHPYNDKVRRLMDRIGPVAEPGTPTQLEDVRVDVWGSTAAEPKDFGDAFDAIDRFAQSASPADSAGIEQLRQETLTAEKEFYDEKLADAAVVYDRIKYPDKYQPKTAIEDMVRLVVGLRTEGLRSDAARRLLGITEFTPEMLAAYKRTQPDRFKKMMTEPSVRAFAEKSGLN